MSTRQERISTWSRRLTLAGACFLVATAAAALFDTPRRTVVTLGLLGFVFHTVFGKGYALLPTYFDRDLASQWLPVVQLPLSTCGAILLAVDPLLSESVIGAMGSVLWLGGVVAFVGGLAWTVRDNPTGADTGTGDHNRDRASVDRVANLAVPAVLGYVLAGSYELAAASLPIPTLLSGYPPRATHLLAVGGATLLVFAVGFRLVPRFLGPLPPFPLVVVAVAFGTVAPAGLAATIPADPLLPVFAVLEAIAVLSYAATVLLLFARCDRNRVGSYGISAGALAAVAVVGLGTWFAAAGVDSALVEAHVFLGLVGFLGLTIVGVSYQFYPPAVSQYPGGSDRTALASIGAITVGIVLQVPAAAVGADALRAAALVAVLAGAILYAFLLGTTIASR